MRKHRKAHRRSRLAAGVTALAVAVPLITPAFAICQAPSSGYSLTSVDDNVLKVAAHQDAMVAAEILGANLVATTNLGGEEDYDSSSANFTMGLFGSDINDNPDPYLYNFFYDYANYGYEHEPLWNGSRYSEAIWAATPYTIANDLLYDTGVEEPNGTDTEVVTIDIDGVIKTTVASFYYEPDVLIGSGDAYAYANVREAYQYEYNEDYNPSYVYYNTSDSSTTGNQVDALFGQADALLKIACVMEDTMHATGKSTRYKESPLEIAVNYADYVKGIYDYVIDQMNMGLIDKKTIAINPKYDEESHLWTLTDDTGRIGQYTENLFYNFYDECHTASDTDSITLTTAELTEMTDVIVSLENSDYSGLSIKDVIAMEGLSYEGIIIDSLPLTTYSLLGDSHDNAIGIPWFAGIAYYDQDPNLNPVNLIAYYVEKFYHVSDNSALECVINLMFRADEADGAYNCLPDSIDSLSLVDNGYSAKKVEALYREVTESTILSYLRSAGYSDELIASFDESTKWLFYIEDYTFESSNETYGVFSDEYELTYALDAADSIDISTVDIQELTRILEDTDAVERILSDKQAAEDAQPSAVNAAAVDVALQGISSSSACDTQPIATESAIAALSALTNWQSKIVVSQKSYRDGVVTKNILYTWRWDYVPAFTSTDKFAMAWAGDFAADPSTIKYNYTAHGLASVGYSGTYANAEQSETKNGYTVYTPNAGIGVNIDLVGSTFQRSGIVFSTYAHSGYLQSTLTKRTSNNNMFSAVGSYFHRTLRLSDPSFTFSIPPSISLSSTVGFVQAPDVGCIFWETSE